MLSIEDACGNMDSVLSVQDWERQGGRSSVVEFQPSKLAVVGSNPIARSKKKMWDVKRYSLNVKRVGSGVS